MTVSEAPKPLVSIIVPSFNQGRFLGDTLDSILQQHHRPLEVLVVDGGSTDDTVSILKKYSALHPELRWWSRRDNGPADAVNKGLTEAHGEFAGIQSSDDLYFPNAVAEAVSALTGHPEVDIVYGDSRAIDAQGRFLAPSRRQPAYSLTGFLCGVCFINQNSAFFRIEAARTVGGWRHTYYVADLDMWLRMLLRRPAMKVDSVWGAWRVHDQQRNTRKGLIWKDYRRMIEESEELRKQRLAVRCAAAAGRRMLTQRCNPTGSRLFTLCQVTAALLIYPPAWRALRFVRGPREEGAAAVPSPER